MWTLDCLESETRRVAGPVFEMVSEYWGLHPGTRLGTCGVSIRGMISRREIVSAFFIRESCSGGHVEGWSVCDVLSKNDFFRVCCASLDAESGTGGLYSAG